MGCGAVVHAPVVETDRLVEVGSVDETCVSGGEEDKPLRSDERITGLKKRVSGQNSSIVRASSSFLTANSVLTCCATLDADEHPYLPGWDSYPVACWGSCAGFGRTGRETGGWPSEW